MCCVCRLRQLSLMTQQSQQQQRPLLLLLWA
jgi:hypothetical protein